MISKKMMGLITVLIIIFFGCANPKPLTGGAKDEIKPKRIKSYPENKTLNYKGRLIYMEFDEWIKTNTLQQQLIITPKPKGKYSVKYNQNYIRLIFDKKFDDSTTYTFNFREGVVDLNENNPTIDNKIVFSTGAFLDSLMIEGNIKSLTTTEGSSNNTVGLYPYSDTLDIKKEIPLYITKTDEDGDFLFENIKSNTYLIYAFNDEKNIGKYIEGVDQVGFLKDSIKLTKNIDDLQIIQYKEDTKPPRLKSKKQLSTTQYQLRFSEKLETIKIETEELEYKRDLDNFGNVNLFNTKNITDTIQVRFTAIDSSNNVLQDTVKLVFKKKKTKAKAKIDFEPKKWMTDSIKINVVGNKPLKGMILDSLMYKVDKDTIQVLYKDLTTNNDQIIFNKKIDWKEKIEIDLSKCRFITIDQDTIKGKEVIYNKKLKEEFGEIELTIQTEIPNYIILLIDSKNKIIRKDINPKLIKYPNMEAGSYKVKAIIDENKNGRWDQGKYKIRKYPEQIIEFSKTISLRKNWEIKEKFEF